MIKKELFKGHKEENRLKAEESFLPRHRSAGSPIVFAGFRLISFDPGSPRR